MYIERAGQEPKLERGDLVIHVFSRPSPLNGSLAVVVEYVPGGGVGFDEPDAVRIVWISLADSERTAALDESGYWTVAAWEKVGHIDNF